MKTIEIKYSFESVENINGERIATTNIATMSEWDWNNGGCTNSLLTFIEVIEWKRIN